MLVHLDIKNLTVVKQVAMAVQSGLTAITGETGAGKSIALDALGLCLGERADSGIVRLGADKSEIIAHFDVNELPHVQTWLNEHELNQDDNKDECFIRRVVSIEGRSKAFVNGIPVNLNQLKSLGKMLVNIHGQHDNHSFLKAENQLLILDAYAKHPDLLKQMTSAYQQYKTLNNTLNELQNAQKQRTDRVSLLGYQVSELDEFSTSEDEFTQLETEFKKLSSMQTLIESSDKACYLLKDGEPASALDLLNHGAREIQAQLDVDSGLSDAYEMLQNAIIQAQEAYSELDHYRNSQQSDPQLIAEIEARYGKYLELSRKHNVPPEQLYSVHEALSMELKALNQEEASLESIVDETKAALNTYWDIANKLHKSREKAAKKLSSEVETNVKLLNMPYAVVNIEVHFNSANPPSSHGNDHVNFMVSVNPGQVPDNLEKVVSGGELSRFGLVLQVIYSRDHQIPTLIFDEVDTGISGQTATVVGRLLHQLGEKNQVVCVTHLPQVAAQAHNQLFVNKITDGKTTETQVLKLSSEDRINEIARLLAGDELSDKAIENAKDLLQLN
ncbi:DNA repair protein RecN [Agaribacter marinus]|uniref:DNA repair protein RecN n=1 Tax=Agaribacter marinus TaxID=1431249 RepID=A0AA37SYK6_9ALTE|nr:DNA repair protein RecN [Agaribacter marinus]GLR70599.1 DNA repair protein RecN [Agaribacter marinus]